MTASEIQNIVITVGLTQVCCDLFFNYWTFSGDKYKRLIGAMERAKFKVEKAEADLKKNPNKNAKRHQRAKDDFSTAQAEVAKQHIAPSTWSSIIFMLILRILGTEHKGKVMALIPFEPWTFIQRVSARGLDWSTFSNETLDTSLSTSQCASFLCIYLLSALTVKYYVHRAVGTHPPPGADGGIMSMLDSPQGQRMMRQWGVEPDDFKQS